MNVALGPLLADCGLPPLDATDARASAAVSAVRYDSRAVSAGDVFVAVRGFHVDGHDFAAAASRAGAAAVIAEHPVPDVDTRVPVIIVENSRRALAEIAASLAGRPSRRLCVVGITGTDGKTTTTTMLWAAWQAAGLTAAASTTVDFRIGADSHGNASRDNAPPTTGEAPEVQERLRRCADAGCTHVALETSSHALELHRTDSIEFMGAVYTRITSEHLDLHGSLEGYVRAKSRLLELLDPDRTSFAVLDFDDPYTESTLRGLAPSRHMTYSATGDSASDVVARDVHAHVGGTHVSVQTPWGDVELSVQIPGRFNVSNALAALSAALQSGASLSAAAQGISELPSVDGRMERVDLGQDFAVVVDYAHTADALAKVLAELRPITNGNLWVVFGSAGERDRGKRPQMGRAAAQLADRIVITDEDPRAEDSTEIIEMIAEGAEENGARRGVNLELIPDRVEAVHYAIGNAARGDTVLLAGKGHETTIIGAHGSVPYSERAVAEDALRQRLGG